MDDRDFWWLSESFDSLSGKRVWNDYWSLAVLLSSMVWPLGGIYMSQVCGGWWRQGITADWVDWNRVVGSRSWCVVAHQSVCQRRNCKLPSETCPSWDCLVVWNSLYFMLWILGVWRKRMASWVGGNFLALGFYWGFVYTANRISSNSV